MENTPKRLGKPTLDKDLDKLTRVEAATQFVSRGLIAPGISLPHLAMSCATLADGIAGRLSARELEAARYEIETLLPVPDGPRMRITIPDVPAASLSRGPRRRT